MRPEKKICFIGLGGYSAFMSVDHFNAIGETVAAESFYAEPGGKGFNQAVAAARLGAQCAFVGAFGRDDTARLCLDFLAKEGIAARPVYKDLQSAYACILTDKRGENRVTVYGGAAALLDGDDIWGLEGEIKDSSMLVLQNEVHPSANRAAFDVAEKYGLPVVANPAPAVGLDAALLKRAFVITPNEQEAEYIFGRDWASGMKNAGIRRAVVTLGGRGCAVYEDGAVSELPAVRANVVDTTGAGDCFTGALCVKLAGGFALIDAARFAAKAASAAVERRYAVRGLPLLSELV